jgi:DNA-binding XRE family transcriptional regulator
MVKSPVSRKTFQEYLAESFERDPELARLYEESGVEISLGLALYEARTTRGMSQQQLAESCGTSQPAIHRIEKGAQTASITTLWKILRALNAEAHATPSGYTVSLLSDPFAE